MKIASLIVALSVSGVPLFAKAQVLLKQADIQSEAIEWRISDSLNFVFLPVFQSLESDDNAIFYRQAFDLYSEGRYDRALVCCQQILKASPSDIQVQRLLRMIVRARKPLGDFDTAQERKNREVPLIRSVAPFREIGLPSF